MKIIAISDIHGDLIDNIPQCDVLCIAGDIVPLNMQRNIGQSCKWIKTKFLAWCQDLRCDYIILVAGNHDFYFDMHWWDELAMMKIDSPETIFKNTKIHYLQDSGIIIDGKSFYGTPWITGLPRWAFNLVDDDEAMSNIPNCDVLITHTPPRGNVGTVLQDCWNTGSNFGSKNLRTRLEQGGIKYCLSGHIHSGQHKEEIIGEARCYNVSIKDENYTINYIPLILDI